MFNSDYKGLSEGARTAKIPTFEAWSSKGLLTIVRDIVKLLWSNFTRVHARELVDWLLSSPIFNQTIQYFLKTANSHFKETQEPKKKGKKMETIESLDAFPFLENEGSNPSGFSVCIEAISFLQMHAEAEVDWPVIAK